MNSKFGKLGKIGEKKSSENQTTQIKCVKFGLEMRNISLSDMHDLLVKFFNEKTMKKIEVFSKNVSDADSVEEEENSSLTQISDSGAE
jgi:biotin carboxylase